HHLRRRWLRRRRRAPVQSVAEQLLVAGARLGRRRPERDDVVVGLVVGGQLDQLDRAFAPCALGLHPQAGAAIVERAVVLVVVEVAVTLQQAEAARAVVGERAEADARGVGQRAPDPFAAAG